MKPMLMGAMIGAGMGLIQGKDPLKSALIGGATAGIGDKVMGAGGLFDVGSEALSNSTSGLLEGVGAELGSNNLQHLGQFANATGESVGAFSSLPSYANQATQSISPNWWDKGVKQVGDVMDQGVDMVDSNSLGLGLQAYQMANEETPPIQPRTSPQVIAGNYATREQPMAINVPRPNAVYSAELSQADDYRKRYRG
jgi:hypothetical protein